MRVHAARKAAHRKGFALSFLWQGSLRLRSGQGSPALPPEASIRTFNRPSGTFQFSFSVSTSFLGPSRHSASLRARLITVAPPFVPQGKPALTFWRLGAECWKGRWAALHTKNPHPVKAG